MKVMRGGERKGMRGRREMNERDERGSGDDRGVRK